jgi:hypothetical protein|tara:strand:- start:70 stop:279 length:210 start_codon:yes stop_codon:yes gene_type:complete
MNIKEAFKPDLKDKEQGYLHITFTKDRLIELYLDYVNNFLTVPAFAQWHELTEIQAHKVIKRGRELNNE